MNTQKITIRPALPTEISWINTTYQSINFVDSHYENEFIVIAEIAQKKVGLGRLVKIDPQHIELGGIYVFPNFRRLGVAQQIVHSLIQKNPFKGATIWCLPFEKLLDFYAKFGFQHCQHTNDFVPAVVLKKHHWCNEGGAYQQKVLLLCKKGDILPKN